MLARSPEGSQWGAPGFSHKLLAGVRSATIGPLVPCISRSLPKARGHFVCWQGVPTKSYLDISTAFRSEPVERRARPKAELQRCGNEASAQKGPRIR